jgi:tocopherol O-methyltransferase
VIASRKEIRRADVASHYDELDRFYREIWGEHVHHGLWERGDETRDEAVRQLAELVAREAAVEKGSRVIDIGCGYGATAELLAEEFGARVTGMTVSSAQHAIAEANAVKLGRIGGDEVAPRYLLDDWLSNKLPAESFDVAVAIESSEHMDKAGFFAQAWRVLRPGGRLVVTAWMPCETPTRAQERWLLEPICREGRMPHLGTESDYRRLATDAGFAIDRFQDVTRQIARTWPMIVRVFLWNLVCKPSYVRFILDPRTKNAIFGVTIIRLWLAFRTGAMRYGIFTLRKPQTEERTSP